MPSGTHDLDASDEQRMANDASLLRTHAEGYLTEWFGERCPDVSEECECCKRWKALDLLVEQ